MTAPPDSVARHLRAWAKGMYTIEAGTELLLRAFDGRFARMGNPWIEGGAIDCWVNFSAIPDHIGALSGGEQHFLMIAASLGADNEPVDLSHSVSGLDRGLTALLLAAISHATGSHSHTEFLPTKLKDGTLAIGLESPRIELGPTLPVAWPRSR